MKSLLVFLTTAVLLHGPLSAQTSPDASTSRPTGKRNCRIIFPERPRDAPMKAFLFDGKKNHEVQLPSVNFSEVVSLPAGELYLYLSPTEIIDVENLPMDVPRLQIAENVREFYILLSPDRSKPEFPVRMNLVNTSEGKLKPGETLWFNLTEHRIVAMLGDTKLSVKPKSATVCKGPIPDSGYYEARFAYQREGQGKFHKITEQHWWHDAASKHVGFIVNCGGRLPKIYFYRDYRP